MSPKNTKDDTEDQDYHGGIIRVVHNADNRFVQINIESFANKDLSWAGQGMLDWLMAKPDDWQVRVTALVEAKPQGKEAVQTILKHLEALGYLHREKVRLANGQYLWVSTVYETIPETGTPQRESPSWYSGNQNTTTGITSHGSAIHGKARRLIKGELINTEPTILRRSPASQNGIPESPPLDHRRNKEEYDEEKEHIIAALVEMGVFAKPARKLLYNPDPDFALDWSDPERSLRACQYYVEHTNSAFPAGSLLSQFLQVGYFPPDPPGERDTQADRTNAMFAQVDKLYGEPGIPPWMLDAHSPTLTEEEPHDDPDR